MTISLGSIDPMKGWQDGRCRTIQFPITREPHLATVLDKTRNSGLTSVRFLDDQLLVVCDFNERSAYLAELTDDGVVVLDTHPTLIADGSAVVTDLLDCWGNQFVVTNFYQGSISFYEVRDRKIHFLRELNHNEFRGIHGVRYVPTDPSLLWLTYCGRRNKCHQIIDAKDGAVLHHFDTDQHCQDVAFLGDKAVVFARTDHIRTGTRRPGFLSRKRIIFATAYIYQLGDSMRTAPVLIDRWKGEGHLDACKEYEGEIYAANQYLDRVDVLGFGADQRFGLRRSIPGAGMPHGLDVRNDLIAVTNYADQTLRLLPLQ